MRVLGYSCTEDDIKWCSYVYTLNPVIPILMIEMYKERPETRVLDMASGTFTKEDIDLDTLDKVKDFLVVNNHIHADDILSYFRDIPIEEIDGA